MEDERVKRIEYILCNTMPTLISQLRELVEQLTALTTVEVDAGDKPIYVHMED
jgi:hypothetical protein